MILLRTKSNRLQSKKWNKSLGYDETFALPARLQGNKQSNFQTAHDRVISPFRVGMCRRRLACRDRTVSNQVVPNERNEPRCCRSVMPPKVYTSEQP